MRFLLVAVLLAASTTLMAQTEARSFTEKIALRQTNQLDQQLDLSRKQENKILAINQKFTHREFLLVAQRRELQKEGFMNASVQQIFKQGLSKYKVDRMVAIKSVLNDEQLVTFENSSPTFLGFPHRKDMNIIAQNSNKIPYFVGV